MSLVRTKIPEPQFETSSTSKNSTSPRLVVVIVLQAQQEHFDRVVEAVVCTWSRLLLILLLLFNDIEEHDGFIGRLIGNLDGFVLFEMLLSEVPFRELQLIESFVLSRGIMLGVCSRFVSRFCWLGIEDDDDLASIFCCLLPAAIRLIFFRRFSRKPFGNLYSMQWSGLQRLELVVGASFFICWSFKLVYSLF